MQAISARPSMRSAVSRTRSVQVKAQQTQPQKTNFKAAAAAIFTAAALVVMPAFAEDKKVTDDTVRPAVCAGNPTAKICLKDSALRK
mmetsp:Transcript_6369/g.14135  ORF Transcript_6369/g.14135 Transcript_6369/m.14135 type:complete len:87 (+) Transcript_6369:78-338(+)|eukprot:CAMPEP_0202889920 /NCGR_PEP_ID=MMETSP1392-20130828/456_1 /ASSEMBLY_ACC=CAM_ASM_000868 /TAXON_ID=225041 /ORGANISM="Chlamydomonas chlamydogama, Strain SAG 11-48b" /LENGTH=86 /DNA_ID=CAMNT_0049573363 /DNA_START=51 /DNA_END=311 /DNA_ORIENTATION=+